MKEKNSKLFVYGLNVAQEVLMHQPSNVLEVYISQGKAGEEAMALGQAARKAGLIVRALPEKKLKEYVGSVKHQGVVLKLKNFEYVQLDDMLKKIKGENPAILIMDQVEDPHNVGAIIRSATALGISGIVMLNHHQAPVNATSYKTSAGTIGRLPIVRVSNVSNVITSCKKHGYWVAGLDMDGESIEGNEHLNGSPMAFVIGNEGTGLKEGTKTNCDFLFSIPMEKEVESLNASVSAAVLMYEWRRGK